MVLQHFYKRRNNDSFSRMEKVLKALKVACVILVLVLIINNAKSIILWVTYEKDTTATVTSIEAQAAHVQAYSINQYKITYTYRIEGHTYERVVSGVVNIPGIEEGQGINIRYDKDNYALSISELDVVSSEYLIWSTLLLAAGIFGILVIMCMVDIL